MRRSAVETAKTKVVTIPLIRPMAVGRARPFDRFKWDRCRQAKVADEDDAVVMCNLDGGFYGKSVRSLSCLCFVIYHGWTYSDFSINENSRFLFSNLSRIHKTF